MKFLKEPQKKWIFSAPICGFTRFPYRKILSHFPIDLIFTEMVSIDALYYQNPNTLPLLAFEKNDTATGVQLVGSKNAFFLSAVERLKDKGYEVFDINLGCPVKKVLKAHAGSYLLQFPEKINQIFPSLKKEFPPILFSGKIRLGYSEENKNYLEVAKALEEGGASFITVHGRTRPKMYSGEIDYEAIKNIKDQVKIPVIGNGNIFTAEDAKKMIDLTGCDGVMPARGMLGNPWLFREIRDFLDQGKYSEPTLKERAEIMAKNFYYEVDFDKRNGYKEFKKNGMKYLKGFPEAAVYRKGIAQAHSAEQLKVIVEEILSQHK